MPTIFVSHSTTDDAHASRIHHALEAAGIDAWVDHEDGIGPGDRWPQQIQEAANTCDAGLLILTPNSARSAYCEAEWMRVLDRKKLFTWPWLRLCRWKMRPCGWVSSSTPT